MDDRLTRGGGGCTTSNCRSGSQWNVSIVPTISKQVTQQANVTTPATSQASLPVNDDGRLRALLAYLFCYDVVPQSEVGPADEGRLPIKAGPHGGQALGRGV